VRATLGTERRRLYQASGVLTLAEDEQLVLAEAQGTFMSLTTEVAEMVAKDYPGMGKFFGQ